MANETASYVSLDPLFHPKNVAILGASEKTYKLGYLQVKALLDGKFQGDIYPINPQSDLIEGLTCYPSIADVPAKVDLAIFCVAADKVKESLIDCAANNVKAAIVFASGFSETGEDGLKEQEEISRIAKENGIRMIGPNCVGLVNMSNGLIGTFSGGMTMMPVHEQKDIGYITQSGAFGILTYMAAALNGITFNYFVSVGNEMETEFSDVMEYMVHDPNIKVIGGYLEGAKNPEKMRKMAKQALSMNKPIMVMKTGRSEAGSRAAASHTGSLAGSDRIYDAFFKQTGILRADDYIDLISFTKLFRANKLPAGRNTVIITSSGGLGINGADVCEANGLTIHPLRSEIKSEIEKHIPEFASASNPIDLTAAASVSNHNLYVQPLKVLVNDPDTDIIIFTEVPNLQGPVLEDFIETCKASDKFVMMTPFPLIDAMLPKCTSTLIENGIPVVPGNLNPVKALSNLVTYSEKYRTVKKSNAVTYAAAAIKKELPDLLQPGKTLSESQASAVLGKYGIPTTIRKIASTVHESVQFANSIGYPVVLKIDSPDIPHKTEADAIRLNVNNEQEVRNAFTEIYENARNYNPGADIHGVSVQEMLPEGLEIIIGMSNDPVFGPVIMFGLGGIFVEVYKDVSFRVAPLTREDAVDMIEEIKGYSILKGVRGKPSVDIKAIVDVLMKVSDLVTDHGDRISELDMNPLIVYEKGIKAADALIVVKDAEKTLVTGG